MKRGLPDIFGPAGEEIEGGGEMRLPAMTERTKPRRGLNRSTGVLPKQGHLLAL